MDEEIKRPESEANSAPLGIFPILLAVLGAATLVGGILMFSLQMGEMPNPANPAGAAATVTPEGIEKAAAASNQSSMLLSGMLAGMGAVLLAFFFLMKDLRRIEGKMSDLTEQAFDREVASLLAALRPFAERLEERISPVLTASQKFAKPLETVHTSLQKQELKIEEIAGSFEEIKVQMSRLREDSAMLSNRGKSLEPIQQQLEQLKTVLINLKAPTVSLEPLQTAITNAQQEERNGLAKLHTEISKSQALIHQSLEAASLAASAAQKSAESAEKAVNLFEQLEFAQHSAKARPGSILASAPAPAPVAAPAGGTHAHEQPVRKAPEPPSTSPSEKKSVLDAIAKLKNLRGPG